MKKTYITPAIIYTQVKSAMPLAASYTQSINDVETEDGGGELGVRSSMNHYNVWDECWDE